MTLSESPGGNSLLPGVNDVFGEGTGLQSSGGSGFLDGFQTVLDVAGLIPVIGEIADGANALIYLGRGDYVNASLSAAAMIPFAGWAATGGKFVNKGRKVLSKADHLRIENAATRINKPITVVGSRANGTAGAYSDWDYIIEGGITNSREWSKIKNSLPGAKSALDNTPSMIDIHKGPVWPGYPSITIYPR